MKTAILSLLATSAVAKLEFAAVAEGDGYAKAITLTNTGCDTVHLGDYRLKMYMKKGNIGWSSWDEINKDSKYATYTTVTKKHQNVWGGYFYYTWDSSAPNGWYYWNYYNPFYQKKVKTGEKDHFQKRHFKSWAGEVPSGESITVCNKRAGEKLGSVNAEVWNDNCDYTTNSFQINGNDVTKLLKLKSGQNARLESSWTEVDTINEKRQQTGTRTIGGTVFDQWRWGGAASKNAFPFSTLPGCTKPQLEIAAVAEGTRYTKGMTLTNTGCEDAPLKYYKLRMYYNNGNVHSDKWNIDEMNEKKNGQLRSAEFPLPENSGVLKPGQSVTVCNSQCDPTKNRRHTYKCQAFHGKCDLYTPSGYMDFSVDGNDLTELLFRFDNGQIDVVNEQHDQTCTKTKAGCKTDNKGTGIVTKYCWMRSRYPRRYCYHYYSWWYGWRRYCYHYYYWSHQACGSIRLENNPHLEPCFKCTKKTNTFPTSTLGLRQNDCGPKQCSREECKEWTCEDWCRCFEEKDEDFYSSHGCAGGDDDECVCE